MFEEFKTHDDFFYNFFFKRRLTNLSMRRRLSSRITLSHLIIALLCMFCALQYQSNTECTSSFQEAKQELEAAFDLLKALNYQGTSKERRGGGGVIRNQNVEMDVEGGSIRDEGSLQEDDEKTRDGKLRHMHSIDGSLRDDDENSRGGRFHRVDLMDGSLHHLQSLDGNGVGKTSKHGSDDSLEKKSHAFHSINGNLPHENPIRDESFNAIHDKRIMHDWNSGPMDDDDRVLERVCLQATRFAPRGFENSVIVLLSNSGFHDMLVNFVHHAHRLNPPVLNYVVFPIENEAARNASADGFRYYYPDGGLSFSRRPRSFQGYAYNLIVFHRWHIAERLLRMGFEPFIIDVDSVLLRNPYNYFIDTPKCDATGVPDSQHFTLLENTEERYADEGNRVWINGGFLLWRNTLTSLWFVRWVSTPTRRFGLDDQSWFCRLLTELMNEHEAANLTNVVNVPILDRLHKCSVLGNMTWNLLPPGFFGSQNVIFRKHRFLDKQMAPPYNIHFNVLLGHDAKKDFMMQLGLWNLTLP